MKITEKELKNGIEVDCGQLNGKLMTIKYEQITGYYVLSEVKTGNYLYAYKRLESLIKLTNRIVNLQDVAIEE